MKMTKFRTLFHTMDIKDQQKRLEETLSEWQAGKHEQTDDILIMGIRY